MESRHSGCLRRATVRFSALKRKIPTMTEKMLALQLRQKEKVGISSEPAPASAVVLMKSRRALIWPYSSAQKGSQ